MTIPTVKRTYQAWLDMIQQNVQVYPRWLIFANFHADMGDAPAGALVARVSLAEGFIPGNCVWEEGNAPLTLLIVEDGKQMTLAEACRLHEVPPANVWYRMRTKRCSFGQAVRYCQQQTQGREQALAALNRVAEGLFE